MKTTFKRTALLLSILAITGCSSLVNGLRRDLDDSEPAFEPPVEGGRFQQGFLSESVPEAGEYDRYNAVGHSERAPASAGYNRDTQTGSWIGSEQVDADRRDVWRGEDGEARGPASMSDVPSMPPVTKRKYKNGNRATRADFIDESPNEGSLWASDGQTNYYFTKNKVRGVGDILTVNLEAEVVKDMKLEMRRRLSPGEMAKELSAAQAVIRDKAMSGGTATADAGTGDRAPAAQDAAAADKKKSVNPPNENEIPIATAADVDLTKSVELKAGDSMLAEILERYPNGNYKIRGTKRIPYKNGAPRLMTMVGIVRGTDITEDDQVNSGKLYEYRLESTR